MMELTDLEHAQNVNIYSTTKVLHSEKNEKTMNMSIITAVSIYLRQKCVSFIQLLQTLFL